MGGIQLTVFYPYTQTKDDGLELRFSIRSMVKHFTDMKAVIVVGEKPSWYTGDHIYFPDVEKRKEYSVLRKLLLVPADMGTPLTLLFCHDDVYALKDFDSSLPNYYRGTCREGAMTTKERRFKDMFNTCPPDWLNFEIHAPMIINTELIEDEDRDFLLKTTYANRNKLPGTDIADCKIKDDLYYSEARKIIKGRPFWSTHDNAENGVLTMLKELYPLKSIYET